MVSPSSQSKCQNPLHGVFKDRLPAKGTSEQTAEGGKRGKHTNTLRENVPGGKKSKCLHKAPSDFNSFYGPPQSLYSSYTCLLSFLSTGGTLLLQGLFAVAFFSAWNALLQNICMVPFRISVRSLLNVPYSGICPWILHINVHSLFPLFFSKAPNIFCHKDFTYLSSLSSQ